MKELLNLLIKVCEVTLNETHSEELAVEQMQIVVNDLNTKGLYPTKYLVKIQSMFDEIIDCFDLVIECDRHVSHPYNMKGAE